MMPGLDDFFSRIKKVLGSSIGVLVVVALLLFSVYYFCFLPWPIRPPSILIDDTLYVVGATTINDIPEDAKYLGEIEETVSPNKTPSQNFQANHAVKGSDIYLLKNGDIIVETDKGWQRYYKYSD